MNIPSTILIEAINFVKNHERTKKWFDVRDRSIKMTVKSIKSEIYKVSLINEVIFIKISVDYLELTPEVGMVEDIIIYLTWQLPYNYKIIEIRAVPGT